MWNVTKCCALLGMLQATPGLAICEDGKDTYAINDCLKKEIDAAENLLAKTYGKVTQTLAPKDRNLVAAAQATWLNYKANELAAVASVWSEGTYSGIRYGFTKYNLIESRIKALNGLVSP